MALVTFVASGTAWKVRNVSIADQSHQTSLCRLTNLAGLQSQTGGAEEMKCTGSVALLGIQADLFK